MKKTMVSLVAAAALTTGAFAADKGIDIVTNGQAVVYYETHDMNGNNAGTSLFDQGDSTAAAGIQLDLAADLKNNFTFGAQLTYITSQGLEKNLVGGMKQTAGTGTQGSTTDDIALTKIFVAKKIANTTVKLGRQELPKSLSPLAFSEGWNVYKNTFDAIVAINTDIPKTTLVGAFVSGGTNMTLGTTGDLVVANNSVLGNLTVDDTAYMLTASTTVIPMTTLTASYYHLSQIADDRLVALGGKGIAADALWIDAKIADKSFPMGLNAGLQYGNIDPDSFDATSTALIGAQMTDTTAWGAKVSLKPMPALTLCAAYTDVDGDANKVSAAIKNTGTGIKTPLFTQMIYNQNAIALDASTLMLKAAYSLGDMGTVSATYGMTDGGKANLMGVDANGNGIDYNELDLVYKTTVGGVDYFAAYVMRDIDKGGVINTTVGNIQADTTDDSVIRMWARYNF